MFNVGFFVMLTLPMSLLPVVTIEASCVNGRSIIGKLIEAGNARYGLQSKLSMTWLSMSFIRSLERICMRRLSNVLPACTALYPIILVHGTQTIDFHARKLCIPFLASRLIKYEFKRIVYS